MVIDHQFESCPDKLITSKLKCNKSTRDYQLTISIATPDIERVRLAATLFAVVEGAHRRLMVMVRAQDHHVLRIMMRLNRERLDVLVLVKRVSTRAASEPSLPPELKLHGGRDVPGYGHVSPQLKLGGAIARLLLSISFVRSRMALK
jgi:hypothetical protein